MWARLQKCIYVDSLAQSVELFRMIFWLKQNLRVLLDPNLRQEASNAKLDAKLPGIKILEESLQSKNAARSGKFSDCCFRSKVLIRCRQQKVASKVNLSGRLLFVLEWKEAGKGWTSTASLKIISFTRTEERRGIPAKIFSSHSEGDSKIGSSLRVLLWWEPLRTMWINWRTFQLWMEFAGFSSGGQSNQIDTLTIPSNTSSAIYCFVTNFMNILNMRIAWPGQWSFSQNILVWKDSKMQIFPPCNVSAGWNKKPLVWRQRNH